MLKLNFLSNNYDDTRSHIEKAEDALALEILTGEIPSGKQLVEQKLCARFNISRTLARDILHNLSARGLVEMVPNRGAFAKGITYQQMKDVFYMRTLLYPQCVAWAIDRITADEMEMLEETFSFMEFYTETEDLSKMTVINTGFENIIYHSCHCPEMEQNLLRYDFICLHYNANVRYPQNYLKTVLEEHRYIMQAFRQKDQDMGSEAAQIHAFKSMIRRK